MSDSDEKAVKKTRILQRKDGAIFTWTRVLDVRSDMHAGWMYEFEDGTKSIQLDKASRHEIDTSLMSKREAALIEENAQLRETIAKLQAFPSAPIQDAPDEAPVTETFVPESEGEVPIEPEMKPSRPKTPKGSH